VPVLGAEPPGASTTRPRPLVQGILNVTPDSFSDGGAFGGSAQAAVEAGLTMLRDGADIIDVGGESTRPGAAPVSAEEEQRRVLPVIAALAARCEQLGLPLAISIDTRNADTARLALAAGASIVNDVTSGRHDAGMMAAAAAAHAPMVFMHSRATPLTMDAPEHTRYGNLVHDVSDELAQRLQLADGLMPRWTQLVDPGLGFAKTAEQSRALLQPEALGVLRTRLQGRPVLVGASRKRFLATSGDTPRERDDATAAANALAVLGGASILRVHNVAAARRAVDAAHAVLSAASDGGAQG